MYIPLGIKTDHSLLQSMIKIDALIAFLKASNLNACGICDDNMAGVIEFYHKCSINHIKPLIGLTIKLEEHDIYLYAKNYAGYQNLLKLNTLKQKADISVVDLEKYSRHIICIIAYQNKDIYANLKKIYEDVYIGYASEYEKNNALIITKDIVFFNIIKALKLEDTNYLKYLDMINNGTNIHTEEKHDYSKNYYLKEYSQEDEETVLKLASLIDIKIPYNNKYIPKYKNLDDSYKYLYTLTHKGLQKRLNNVYDEKYFKRLEYELSVIKEMGFVDYFLIVYDYILYAKKNDILVGPGRGSAAGSIVAYSLGITDIDPLKYDLLFERFLNKERVTMPDIDIDFEDIKRGQIIDYLKEKYGNDNVANIMTYSSLTSKQVLRDVGKILDIEDDLNSILKLVEPKLTLRENYQHSKELQAILKKDKNKQILYKIALKIEGLKRQVSTHAAGVVISSVVLDNLIPIVLSGENVLTGCTMEYLEDLGLIKMDILSLGNLRIIHDVLNLIAKETGNKIKLADIPLDDAKTLEMFKTGNTIGVFQFESTGMKNFLKKLKPSSFEELVAAIALFRPGPMDNIDEFIKRKEGKSKIIYIHADLEDILKSTYGIIVYQEQIMQILVKMGGYSYSEADNIRRAMSKKKVEVIEGEKNHFILNAQNKGYTKDCAMQVYDLILKFANYGFNKSHSVAYALVGYQMAYLKAHYESIFYANLLNMSIASEIKTNEYLQVIKKIGLKIYAPHINDSTNIYKIKNNYLLLPFGVIKNIGEAAINEILLEREKGSFVDFLDFVRRCYGKSITKKTLESLIYAGAFREFRVNKQTLINNIENAITYAELTAEVDSPLVLKPTIEEYPEFPERELIKKEKETLGFYITNHPASRFHDAKIVKLENMTEYFDKFIKCVILVTKISSITTKNGEKMYFVDAEDETASADFIIFPKNNSLLSKFKKDDLIMVTGKVEKRYDKFQIIVSSIEKIN